MSDPVTNVEIEDVLSSIRKLVSDDPRPVEKGVSAAQPVVDRLVLTPDFRVADDVVAESAPADAGNPDAPEAQDADADVPVEQEPDDVFLFDDLSDADESDGDDTGYDPAQGDPADDDAVTDTYDEELEATEAPMTEDAVPEPHQAEVVEMAAPATPMHLASRIAELEAAVARQDDSWDPDGLDDEDENTPAALTESVDDMWETVAPDDIPAPAAPEEAVLEAEEDIDEAPIGAKAADVSDIDDVENFVSEDDAMLDEDALREMVSELVRQELQGTLGARITRNVRKLVRREIHRIMDSKDFE